MMGVTTVLECDICGAELKLEGPYHVAKAEMHEAGWKNTKIDDKWTILCDVCKEKAGHGE